MGEKHRDSPDNSIKSWRGAPDDNDEEYQNPTIIEFFPKVLGIQIVINEFI
jgi:hypothetical protein